ncbi:hypothetical protein K523DRAFT_358989 [Schizophyllum commune Tattone D]|nr:hypothetical protein K523DRAFT_358989 [Schizophyllum commune Tattone D]
MERRPGISTASRSRVSAATPYAPRCTASDASTTPILPAPRARPCLEPFRRARCYLSCRLRSSTLRPNPNIPPSHFTPAPRTDGVVAD